MRAAVYTDYGGPEVVRVVERERPVPGPTELLVRVRAATVNRTDCGVRAASPPLVRLFYGFLRPRRQILGNEFAGDVVAVGNRVEGFAVGDRVFGYQEPEFGGHAEYLTIPETAALATIPDGLSHEEAAPATEGAHYALAYLKVARVGEGTRILINGTSGAIGSAALQICVAWGAVVTAVCPTAQMDMARDFGAAAVIDHTAEDFTRVAGPQQVVFDAVGKSTYRRCRQLIEPGGVYAATELGPWAQNMVLALATKRFGSRQVMFPIPRHNQAIVDELRALLADGSFRPVIDRRYPLDEVVEAYRYVETGTKVGNVLLIP